MAVGNATARTIVFKTRMKEAYYYPDSAWFTGFVGGSYEFLSQPGVRNLEARDLFHYYATGVTPAMALKLIGRGSQYAIATTDSEEHAARREQNLQGPSAAQYSCQGILVVRGL